VHRLDDEKPWSAYTFASSGDTFVIDDRKNVAHAETCAFVRSMFVAMRYLFVAMRYVFVVVRSPFVETRSPFVATLSPVVAIPSPLVTTLFPLVTCGDVLAGVREGQATVHDLQASARSSSAVRVFLVLTDARGQVGPLCPHPCYANDLRGTRAVVAPDL
jgi:hypothetical protein